MDKADRQRQAPCADETRDEILLRLLKTPPVSRDEQKREIAKRKRQAKKKASASR